MKPEPSEHEIDARNSFLTDKSLCRVEQRGGVIRLYFMVEALVDSEYFELGNFHSDCRDRGISAIKVLRGGGLTHVLLVPISSVQRESR